MPGHIRLVEQPVEDWSEAKARAAALLADGSTGATAIASTVGVSRETIWGWSKEEPFKAEVQRLRDAIHAEVWDLSLAHREGRIRALHAAAATVWSKFEASGSPVHYREWRETLKQIAVEVGQWNPRADVRLTVDERPTPIVRVVYGTAEDAIQRERAKIEREVADGTFVPNGEAVEATFRELPKPERFATEPQGDAHDDEWTQGAR